MGIKIRMDIFMDKTSKHELTKILKEKFYCPSKFAQQIETTVQQEKCSYIHAVIIFCEKNKIDLESVPKLLSKPLKEKIKCEAIELNFLKKTSRARLIF